jgi:glycosyltransferase involved in cell wall biosynthesis
MAVIPNFIFGPNALLSLVGFLRRPDRTVPTITENWRQAKVDVVIPAFNEEASIALCLASVARQTLRPHRVILVDDGSTDRTVEAARAFAELAGLNLTVIPRAKPIGKTVTVKRQSREFDGDVEFVLDADTVLDSPDYIARCVEELYTARGIASVCGSIAPLRQADREALAREEPLARLREARPDLKAWEPPPGGQRLLRGLSNIYRSALHAFVEGFIQRGQMRAFGSVLNPAGCAVAYRRRYVKDLFDHYEPIFGDDLTKAEDIFIGMALLHEGYRNVMLPDVVARTRDPALPRLPAQQRRWASSFFRSCADMDGLLSSPFKALRRRAHERRVRESGVAALRKVKEPYRQTWGRDYTQRFGRPIGWAVLFSALEKAAWPLTLAVLAGLGLGKALGMVVAAESLLTFLALLLSARSRRWTLAFQGLLVTPLRYLGLLSDFLSMLAFPFRRPPNTRSWQPAKLPV